MRLLLDTHLLLWMVSEPQKLSRETRQFLLIPDNELVFSVASLWEIAIKSGLRRADFRVDLRLLRRALIANSYEELAITGAHALSVDSLPPLHRDPFDRMLIAQAHAEGITLVTSDAQVAQYPGAIMTMN